MATVASVKYVSAEFERLKESDRRTQIRTNPANNALYTVLSQTVNNALIQARECIIHLGIPEEIHGWRAIDAHRIILAHPCRSTFNKEYVTSFCTDEQHRLDSKIVRIWGPTIQFCHGLQNLG